MRVRLKRDRLLELLGRSGRSQNAWALRMGLSKGHWSDLVNGRHPHPSAKTRERILEAFGVEFDELFEIEDAPVSSGDVHSSLPDRYVLDREIGEGAMGLVHLARDTRFGRQVAIKVVSPEAVSDLGAARFLKEIHRSGRLLHPHVLPVLDAGEAAGHPYYVTPYVAGGSLRSLLQRRRRVPPGETVSILRGVAAALDHAHRHDTLHGDVKPDNILLAEGHAYVADFGLSRAIHVEELRDWDRRPEIDLGAGTPAYVSPEQARGEVDLDARSDVYSLACVAFEMLTGQPPFRGGTTTEVIRRRFDSVPPDPRALAPDLPEALSRVIATAMDVDRENRPATATELVERLELAVTATRSDNASSLARTTISSMARWAATRASNRRRGALMTSILHDLRFSLRSLVQRPLFTLLIIATLALGIGANAAIFSVVDAVVLSPLPYEDPDRLVVVRSSFEGRPCCPLSAPNFLDIRAQADQLQQVAGYNPASFIISGSGEPARLSGYNVTHGLFEVLGARPRIGRFPDADDDIAGADPVAVISDQLWRDRYAADPEVVGSEIDVDSVPHTIIGVAPPGFRVQGTPQIFIPYAWDRENMPGRGGNFVTTIGRLAPDASLEAAESEVEAIYAAIVAEYPTIGNKGAALVSLDDRLIGQQRREPVLILWGAVAMVLLVACANAVNLMLARAEHRQQELAVRAALGAGRGRLIRHFLSESMMIAIAGGAVGIVGAYVGLRFLLAAYGDAVPRSQDVSVDGTVLGFSLALTLAAGLLVGLVPAWQTRSGRLQAALKEQGRSEAGGQSRLRQGLVVLEIGAALVLVVGAGLMIKSFWRVSQVDVGTDADRLLAARISLPTARYGETADLLGFWTDLRQQVERLPGVESASVTSAVPFSGTYNNFSRLSPVENPDLEATFVEIRAVDSTIFETLGLRLLSGRNFTAVDNADDDAEVVTIINRRMAERLFPDSDPVGQLITTGPGGFEIRVVGVVENLREHGPERDVPPKIYIHLPQSTRSTMSLLARTSGDPLTIADDVRGIVRELDPEVPVYAINRLDQLIYQGMGNRRFSLSLLSIFAGLAMSLGAIGIYGVMAYTVEKRTREIGLRQALGASPGSVLRLVVLQGIRLAAVGILIGGVGAFLLRRTISGLLFQVEAFDPAVYVAVAAVLAAVATLACFIPARRAAGLDPMTALREK